MIVFWVRWLIVPAYNTASILLAAFQDESEMLRFLQFFCATARLRAAYEADISPRDPKFLRQQL